MILAVDPDVDRPGLAIFANGRLVAAGRCDKPLERIVGLRSRVLAWVHDRVDPRGVTVVAVEWPRVYPAGKGKPGADPNDLIDLAGAAVAIACAFPGAEFRRVSPREWKGSIPKPKRASDPYLVEARVIDLLSPVERAVWNRDAARVAPTPRLEITDAVGIGLYACGRPLTGERVIAR